MEGLTSANMCQQKNDFKILMKMMKIISTVAVDDDIDDVCRFRFSQLTTASPPGLLTREHLRRLRLFASNICLCGETSNISNILNLAMSLLLTIDSARKMNSCWGHEPSVHKF